MGQDEVFVPFAVAAITPLGCAWVASRFVSPSNKWVYGGVVIGTAYLTWKYIVPRMLTSMGYPVLLKKSAEWERLTTTLSEISAKRSMASMKGKAHNSPNYLGVKKVDWKVAPYDEEMESPYEVWGVFRKLS